jgi:hypothetical protein
MIGGSSRQRKSRRACLRRRVPALAPARRPDDAHYGVRQYDSTPRDVGMAQVNAT